jgi:O-succinylbenzoic acid--CoA ligase
MGATLVPIHPRLTPAEARLVIEVAAPHHELESSDLRLADEGALPSFEAAISRGAEVPDIAQPAPFAIVSTSGTTGRPKGAVLSRRAFLASAEASAHNLGWREGDRWLLNMPLAHVGGLSVLTRCLVARRPVVLLPRFDAALFLEAIERHQVTLASVVPTMLRALLDTGEHAVLRRLRALLLGGAAAPPALLDECAAHRIAALTTYGLTEACSQVTTQAPRDPSVRLSGSGPPLTGFDLRIAGDGGAPLPASTTGRILIRGPALFDGYLQPDGALSAPLTPEGFFDTGDLGELDERGHLHVHARRTDLVVTGGENVYPAEVEQALERLSGVRRALVFGVPDERWGQVVAAVIEPLASPAAPAEPAGDPAALLRALQDQATTALAPHKRPRRWALVRELPLTASGKVDRKDAAERFEALLTPAARSGRDG